MKRYTILTLRCPSQPRRGVSNSVGQRPTKRCTHIFKPCKGASLFAHALTGLRNSFAHNRRALPYAIAYAPSGLREIGRRCPRQVARAESPKHTSVGQRPTFGQRCVTKAVGLAQGRATASRLAVKQCARLSALNVFFNADVGRCPTLVCLGLSALGSARRPRRAFVGMAGTPCATLKRLGGTPSPYLHGGDAMRYLRSKWGWSNFVETKKRKGE